MSTPKKRPERIKDGRSEIVDVDNTYLRPGGYSPQEQRAASDITHIVIHTLGSDWNGALLRFTELKEPRAHFVIKPDGTLTQFAPELALAPHVSISALTRKLYDTGDPDTWMRYVEISTESTVQYRGKLYHATKTSLRNQPIPLELQDQPIVAIPERSEKSRTSWERLYWERQDAIWDDFQYFKALRPGLRQPYNYSHQGEAGNYNSYTLGIELAGLSGQETQACPRGFYLGLDRLLTYLCAKYKIPRTREFIIGHEEVDPIARWGWSPGRAFEWELVCPKTRFIFPLSKSDEAVSPVAQYVNNENPETGAGGTFVLSNNRTLHGGIHLFPEPGSKNTLARCMAPGYVIAARLPPLGTPATSPNILALTNNWTGFVLVRHELEETKPASGQEGEAAKPLAFYSLYMHLAPPDYGRLENDPYLQIPWFSELVKHRFGSWLRVGVEGTPPAGTLYWSREAYTRPDKDYAVHGSKETIRPLDEHGTPTWVFKHPPMNYEKILEELKGGKVVTFPEPFLVIRKAGEAVGLLRPLDKAVALPPRPDEDPGAHPSGILHWEVFTPAAGSSSDIDKVLELAQKALPELKEVLSNNQIAEISDDNFFEVSELRQKVLPKLSQGEQALLERGLKRLEREEQKEAPDPKVLISGYREELKQILSDTKSFALEEPTDGTPPLRGLCYPLALEIETKHLPPPNQNADAGTAYRLSVEYLQYKAAGSPTVLGMNELTVDQGKFNEEGSADGKVVRLMLKVPAAADALKLSASSGSVSLLSPDGPASDDGALLLKKLLPSRLRAVRLTRLNEWSPAGAALFDKLKELKVLPSSFDVNQILPLMWWSENGVVQAQRALISESEAAAPEVENSGFRLPAKHEVKTVGRSDMLFGTGAGQLPVDAKIDNLHPVTLLWLLELLCGRGKLLPKSSWTVKSFHAKQQPPFAWGIITKKALDELALGDKVHALVVDDDYGYDATHSATLQIRMEDGKLVTLTQQPYLTNGFILYPFTIDFWGQCKLLIEGAPETPKQILKTVSLSIPAPEFEPPSEQERQHCQYKPFETATHWVVPIKSKRSRTQPREIPGVVGLELEDGAGGWRDAHLTVDGAQQRLFIPAIAQATFPSAALTVDEESFVVDNGFVVGVKTKGLMLGQKLAFSKNISYSAVHATQTTSPAVVAVSLAAAVQRLREALSTAITITELSRDGRRCILSSVKAYQLAYLACRDRAISAVRIPGGESTLDEKALPEKPPKGGLEKTLKKLGVEVEVTALETKEALLKSPPPPPPPKKGKSAKKQAADEPRYDPANLVTSDDGLFITGIVPGKEAQGNVTQNFGFTEYVRSVTLRISIRLLSGLEELKKKVKCSITYLDWSGCACRVTGKGVVEAAREIAFFAQVEEQTGSRPEPTVMLYVPSEDTLYAAFTPQQAIDELFGELAAQGGPPAPTSYRFYFRAVNAMNERLARLPPHEPTLRDYLLEKDLELLSQPAPASLLFRGSDDACGTLRKLAFEEPTFELIEGHIQVTCQLRGNRTAWAPFQVRLTHLTGDPKTPQSVRDIGCGDQLLTASFPIPANATGTHRFKIEALTREGHHPKYAPPATREVSWDLTPKLGELSIDPWGDDYLLVRCQCTGLEASSQDLAAPDPSEPPWKRSRVGNLTVVPATTQGRELQLTVSPGKDSPRIDYLLPTPNRDRGVPNHDGVFCAFISRKGLKKGEQYTITLKRHSLVRGAKLDSVSKSYSDMEE